MSLLFRDGGIFANATRRVFPPDIETIILSYLDPKLAWFLAPTCTPYKTPEFAMYYAKNGWIDAFIAVMGTRTRGGRLLNEAFVAAACAGREEIVLLCKSWGATEFGCALMLAAENARTDIVRHCQGWGAGIGPDILTRVAAKGHLSIVCLYWESRTGEIRDRLAGNNWSALLNAALAAAGNGHSEIVLFCRRFVPGWYANNMTVKSAIAASAAGFMDTAFLCWKLHIEER